jgi:sporulation protein YlmC with PRC-barrel domain
MREEIALSSILGASVYDSSGAFAGHVREVAIFPQEDPNRISDFIVKTREGDRLLPSRQIKTVIGSAIQVNGSAHDWEPLSSSEGMLLLERDLLDQQIIDVSGRKVVRVNDVDLRREQVNGTLKLKVGRVDIGLRGAIRRLLKGLAPSRAVEALAMRMPEKSIPWEAVDLIETDPARRVRLRLAYERLSKLHPADIADILEELAPGGTRLGTLTPEHVIYVEASASDKDVAEMFDKYNLLTLPVVDEEQRLAGIITADDVISLLRDRI